MSKIKDLQLDFCFGTTKILFPISPNSTLSQLHQGLLNPLQCADLPYGIPKNKDDFRICKRQEVEDGVFKFFPVKNGKSSVVGSVFDSKTRENLYLQFKANGVWQPISVTVPTIEDTDDPPEPFEDEVLSD
ncbi:hypothetical protein [Phaffia rhodozyma]|uniref:Uncharacterized protein n=1 Tax=Phaffia rhodozyma TaxID=264483 RepID=A0A0F7SP71_PHARH|nr:hypothetical protein [Phaffia rhodozyma]